MSVHEYGDIPPGSAAPDVPDETVSRPRFGLTARRWWIVAVAAVVVGATAIVFAVRGGSGSAGAASAYDRVYQAFHSKLAQQYAALQADLGKPSSSDSSFDPAYLADVDDVHALQDTFNRYGQNVNALSMPASAKSDADKLVKAADLGALGMQVAGIAPTAQDLGTQFNATWGTIADGVQKVESLLRNDLGLSASGAATWPA